MDDSLHDKRSPTHELPGKLVDEKTRPDTDELGFENNHVNHEEEAKSNIESQNTLDANNEATEEPLHESASISSDGSDNSSPDSGSKRIILQRFTIYNSLTAMYIVGSNAKESLFRVLEINKDPNNEKNITAIEDRNFFYTRKDMIELINDLNETVEGGIHKVTRGYGLIGLIRFTKGFYLSIITKCSQVAILGGHFVYHIDETKLVPLDIHYTRPVKYSDEERLLSIFKYLDLGKTFYFSYSYDITNTLQTNFMRSKNSASMTRNSEGIIINEVKHHTIDNFKHNDRFVWNQTLLSPLNGQDISTYDWFQPIIHGFVDQANISIYGKKIYITIIARRSHHFAGARFLKRGVNDKGNVANEVETEQIVSDMMTTSFHDPEYGYYNNPRYTSFVQHRGSIPLYWSQDLNKLPKPPIEINLSDPFYQSSALHFNNLLSRYGPPIIILNLIKTKEKHPRELKLNQHFNSCIRYLNQFLPKSDKLQYHSFDMSKHSKKSLDVIGPLQEFAAGALKKTGYFHNGKTLQETKLQNGIIRTNCIDCLDRTNAAQFITCKEALSHQLASLGLVPDGTSLDYDSDLINILTEMFHDHGDTIAVQYGGSNLVNTMDSYRRINQWSSHTRDMLNSVKRIYSNSFMDLIRQEAINLFLGNYTYDLTQPKLWELQNDFYLHNDYQIQDLRIKNSYIQWYNYKHFDDASTGIHNKTAETPNTKHQSDFNLEQNDNWFNECYVPRKFQSLLDLFQFNMNSNARYFPSISSNQFDYSPFKSRKPYVKEMNTTVNIDVNKLDGKEHLKYLDTCDAEVLTQNSQQRTSASNRSIALGAINNNTQKNFLQNYSLRNLVASKSEHTSASQDKGKSENNDGHIVIEDGTKLNLIGHSNLTRMSNPIHVGHEDLSTYMNHLEGTYQQSDYIDSANLVTINGASTYQKLMDFSTHPDLDVNETKTLQQYILQLPELLETQLYGVPKEVTIRDDYFR